VFDRCPVEVPALVPAGGTDDHFHRCLLPDAQRLELWRANPTSKTVEAA